MRSASLDDSRQITSSRQSPRMSALRLGVALVPLFDETPGGASSARRVAGEPVPLGNRRAVEQLAQQIAVPPDAEVDRRFRGRDLDAARPEDRVRCRQLRGVHAARRTRSPHLVAAVPGIDVERQAPADVPRALDAEDQAAGARVAQLERVRAVLRRALVRLEDLEPGPIGIHVRHVDRVAVPQARA